ncbi:retrovirus-related Pol polyprotein from transposon TNT 1-94 [Trifolium pratense]|uniref:Retrovirus-related Pol polyprotein from transposon TNT 1-94 n=1 Tax=Trifolium pratense TaxID=57577 RepID=A0A2K3NV65_TRIPR|nr:retrovirus-related Pol polyprotein from transposon TNT 1-94 [Trifolium pratense]
MVPSHLPIFDGKNYEQWTAKMRVLFRYQDVFDIVSNGIPVLARSANNEQTVAHKDSKKKDGKTLFSIHQCLDVDIFEKILHCERAKDASDTLAINYGGNEKSKKMVRNSEIVSDLMKIEKVLRTITSKFDHIVAEMQLIKHYKLSITRKAKGKNQNSNESTTKGQDWSSQEGHTICYNLEGVMLMTIIKEEYDADQWSLDTGCLGREPGSDFDDSVSRRIRFA